MASEAKLLASVAFWLRFGLSGPEAGARAAESCGCAVGPNVTEDVALAQQIILAGLLFTESKPSQAWPLSMIPVNPWQSAPFEYQVEAFPTAVEGDLGRGVYIKYPSADQLPWDEIARIIRDRVKDEIETSPEGFYWMYKRGVTILPISGIPIKVVGISRRS